jgi:hypothetical protein
MRNKPHFVKSTTTLHSNLGSFFSLPVVTTLFRVVMMMSAGKHHSPPSSEPSFVRHGDTLVLKKEATHFGKHALSSEWDHPDAMTSISKEIVFPRRYRHSTSFLFPFLCSKMGKKNPTLPHFPSHSWSQPQFLSFYNMRKRNPHIHKDLCHELSFLWCDRGCGT